jgi:hypothetical protein
MRRDIKAFVAGCAVCQLNQHYDRSDHVSSALPARPFCDLSVDFLDISPKDRAGYNAALVVVDNFSGFVELFPTKDKEAATAARFLLQVVGRFGAPVTLRSDQAGSFDSALGDKILFAGGAAAERGDAGAAGGAQQRARAAGPSHAYFPPFT